MTSACLVLLCVLFVGASGLQLSARPSAVQHRPAQLRRSALCMQEAPPPTEDGLPSTKLSDETLRNAVETASEPGMTPASTPGAPPRVIEQDEKFDPRIIVYVSLPALVLGAQLFFTFSRDSFSGELALPNLGLLRPTGSCRSRRAPPRSRARPRHHAPP